MAFTLHHIIVRILDTYNYVMLTGKFMQVFRNFSQVILEKHVYIKSGSIVALYMTKNIKCVQTLYLLLLWSLSSVNNLAFRFSL